MAMLWTPGIQVLRYQMTQLSAPPNRVASSRLGGLVVPGAFPCSASARASNPQTNPPSGATWLKESRRPLGGSFEALKELHVALVVVADVLTPGEGVLKTWVQGEVRDVHHAPAAVGVPLHKITNKSPSPSPSFNPQNEALRLNTVKYCPHGLKP